MCTRLNSILGQASMFLQRRYYMILTDLNQEVIMEKEEEFSYMMKTFPEENTWFITTWVL